MMRGNINKHVLLTYCKKYLRHIRGLSYSSVGHYTQALRRISKMFADRKKYKKLYMKFRILEN